MTQANTQERAKLITQKVRPVNPFDMIEWGVKRMEGRPKTAHYASQIIMCPRAAWYAFKQVPQTNPITLASYFKMRVGAAIGEIKTRALDYALKDWYEAHPDYPFTPLIHVLRENCPQMVADIEEASEWAARPFDMRNISDYTIPEVPFRQHIEGLKYPLSGRVDTVANMPAAILAGGVNPGPIPLMMEDKSSSASSTRLIREQKDTWLTYQLQHYTYHHRYPELVTELDYIDREWGYPYRFGMETLEGGITVFQPGGPGRMGTPLKYKLKGMDPWEFIVKRCSWMEELLESDEPPGTLVSMRIEAPLNRGEFKHFTEVRLMLPGNDSLLEDQDEYVLYVLPDGEPIPSRGKQANGVKYRSRTCGTFCKYRDHCMKQIGINIKPDVTEAYKDWGS